MSVPPSPLISIAPMMNCTDRHFRFLARLLTRHALLYTEMITTGQIIYGDKQRFLQFNEEEHPVALQLGGSNPEHLAQSAQIGEAFGYDEINLNVGCPSDRVQSGKIGACLMAEPELVGECVAAMVGAVSVPVTVKTRIGIDNRDSYGALCEFITTVSQAGCDTFIIHARKAWLKGLNPKQNREVPPLRYDIVYQLKSDYPHLKFIINGGIKDIAQAKVHHVELDGVMIGRQAYQNPYCLASVDQTCFGSEASIPTRAQVVQGYIPYIEAQLEKGVPLHIMTRHLLGLYIGESGARGFRRFLTENHTNAEKILAYLNKIH